MSTTVHQAQDFVAKYPLDLRTIVSTPMIFRESVMEGAEKMPYPTMALLRDLAEFSGYGYGALRAAVSRARSGGELSSFTDSGGVARYRTTDLARSVGMVAKAAGKRPGGFIVAVFSFAAEEESPRSRLRETLKYFGFRRIAQNTYINGLIDTAGLEAQLKAQAVEDKVFLFRCPDASEPSLARRLGEVFDIEGRSAMLSEFLKDLRAFVAAPRLGAIDFGRRMFYSGPVFHRICFTEEPPFPESFLPRGYPIAALREFYREKLAERGADLTAYYLKFTSGAV
jgi:DNA-binding transcriptional regulator PaaX